MSIELRIIIYWAVLTGLLYMLTRIHFVITKSNYTWKYFIEEYSYVGVAYLTTLRVGGALIITYGLARVTWWWFNI